MSHSAKIFLEDSFSVALISGTEKVWRREGGWYEDFTSKKFCLTVRKFSVEESFTVALISGIEKVWIGGGVSRFSAEKILSHSAEKSVGESFTVALISGIEKVWMGGGGNYQDFPSNIFVLQCRNSP